VNVTTPTATATATATTPVLPPVHERALPVGWTMAKDPRNGRVYYLNHNLRTTSWDDPRLTPEELAAAKAARIASNAANGATGNAKKVPVIPCVAWCT
jgi:hypothetical protein